MTKPLVPATDNRHLFIVHIWFETGHVKSDGQWRGSIEHVPSGQRIYFVSLDALLEFVNRYWRHDLAVQATDSSISK